LGESEETGILVKVGKNFINEMKALHHFFVLTECQTEMDWFAVETKINLLQKKLEDRPKISVETVLKGNDKLTRFYNGMPTYDLFLALAEYLEPKALAIESMEE